MRGVVLRVVTVLVSLTGQFVNLCVCLFFDYDKISNCPKTKKTNFSLYTTFPFVHLEESGGTVLIWHFKLLLLYKSVLLSIFVPIIPLYIYGNGSRDSLRAYVRAWKKNSLSDSVRSKDGGHKSRRIPTTVSSLMDQAIIISLAFILTFDNYVMESWWWWDSGFPALSASPAASIWVYPLSALKIHSYKFFISPFEVRNRGKKAIMLDIFVAIPFYWSFHTFFQSLIFIILKGKKDMGCEYCPSSHFGKEYL